MERLPIGRDEVERAAEVVRGRLHRTPILSCSSLGEDVFLKAELLQKTGSFKPRGVLNNLSGLSAEAKSRGVIAISAGNHAQAVAWGAAREGLDALLVMWSGASEAKVAATRGYGASVDLDAAGPSEAFERFEALVEETGRTPIHPFDSPPTIAGQGTVGLEILEDLEGVDTIVVPVGGGGLFSGIAAAAQDADVSVVPVEPETSLALHAAVANGRSTPVEAASVADGLNAPFAGEHALRTCVALGIEPVLLSEDEIAVGFRWLYERAKLACEPAGAAAVAAVLAGRAGAGRTVCVVSGGNVSRETAAGILAGR